MDNPPKNDTRFVDTYDSGGFVMMNHFGARHHSDGVPLVSKSLLAGEIVLTSAELRTSLESCKRAWQAKPAKLQHQHPVALLVMNARSRSPPQELSRSVASARRFCTATKTVRRGAGRLTRRSVPAWLTHRLSDMSMISTLMLRARCGPVTVY